MNMKLTQLCDSMRKEPRPIRTDSRLVEEGDIIEIDIPGHHIELKVPEEELERRRAAWTPREPKIKTGYLARYAALVTSGANGAVLEVK